MTLQKYISESYYHGYAYSYPHKMAYRPFESSLSLEEVWKTESKENLFLYIHVPFCEMRCGFCNLFTLSNPKNELRSPFINALFNQIDATFQAIKPTSFGNFALGGGTPTFLPTQELEALFSKLNDYNISTNSIQSAIEVSPQTIDKEKIELLKTRSFFRVSMGVQSFIEEEVKAMGRPQKVDEVEKAIKLLKEANFPLLNLDLIYGAGNQTKESWQYSLDKMVEIAPEEVFLYPLYVRPLTGLGKKEKSWDDFRMDLYIQGRDFLLENGYEQLSMRQFKKKDAPAFLVEEYLPSENPMIGLGVGARSYTETLHYSSDYAVERKGVKNIITDYNQRTQEDFSQVNYGFKLSLAEQKRRYIVKSLCEGGSLNIERYQQKYNQNPWDEFYELEELSKQGLLNENSHLITLNEKGKSLEDVIGPWLYSKEVKEAIQQFELK